MFHNFLKFLALNVLTILSLNAQNSTQHTQENSNYAKGLAEFNNKNYQVALFYFNSTIENTVSTEVLDLLKLESLLLSNNEKGISAANYFLDTYEFSVHKKKMPLQEVSPKTLKYILRLFHQVYSDKHNSGHIV